MELFRGDDLGHRIGAQAEHDYMRVLIGLVGVVEVAIWRREEETKVESVVGSKTKQ